MKVALDEHIPSALIRALQSLSNDGEIRACEVVSARAYSPGPGAPNDVPWIKAFMDDGGDIVLSGDKKMRSVPEVQAAIAEAGAKIYYMPTKWNDWPMSKRAAFILNWWDRIIDHSRIANRGESWIVPTAWEAGEFRKVGDGRES